MLLEPYILSERLKFKNIFSEWIIIFTSEMSCTVCRSFSMLTNSWTVICSSGHQGHYKHVTATIHLHSFIIGVYLFIWSHNFRFSMSLSLSPDSLYRQTTDCTKGGGLTREHCILYIFHVWDRQINIDIGTKLEQNCSYQCKVIINTWQQQFIFIHSLLEDPI
jgi:hypothetical protein